MVYLRFTLELRDKYAGGNEQEAFRLFEAACRKAFPSGITGMKVETVAPEAKTGRLI